MTDTVTTSSQPSSSDVRELCRKGLELASELQRREDRRLAKTDLYWLLTEMLGRKDAKHPWVKARCEEAQSSPNGHLDLWARGHYKSTIITFALTIQEILN